MTNSAPSWPGDFESIARQYWSLLGDSLRQAGGAAMPSASALPDWQQGLGWWSQLMPNNGHQVNDVVERFKRQAGDWYGQMQQVAARFAGQPHSAGDIGQAWREAIGANGDAQGFAELFRSMLSQGQGQGMDGWMEQAKPYIEALQRENARWLHAPTFGLNREHQERWQALALAQQEYQQQSSAFNALMLKTAQRAFGIFEEKLEQHAEPGRQITSARALFDLWIDAAEQSYGEIAMSDEFRHVYGAMTNAQMRLRLGMQREIEQVSALFGMPTRTEVDSAHRKIVELERQLRKQQAGAVKTADTLEQGAAKARPATSRAAAPVPARRKAKAKAKAAPARPAVARSDKASRKSAPAPAKRAALVDRPAVRASKKVVAKKTTTRKGTAGATTISMKDWVARSRSAAAASAASAPVPARPAGKARTGKR